MEAAAHYAQHALVLNVSLNHDLNHRFFEVMAAGVPQVVFGDPGLVGEHRHLAERLDVFWASTLDELEALVLRLFAEPERLRAIPVAPPPYWELKDLLKAAFAPWGFATGRPLGVCLAEPPYGKGLKLGAAVTRCSVSAGWSADKKV